MGAGLAIRALQQPVDDDAKTVLVAMALMALDAPKDGQQPGIYWGGYSYLIEILRGQIDPESPEYDAASQSVRRRIRKLIKAGAIERVAGATGHRRARYRLTLDPTTVVDNPVDNLPDPEL